MALWGEEASLLTLLLRWESFQQHDKWFLFVRKSMIHSLGHEGLDMGDRELVKER